MQDDAYPMTQTALESEGDVDGNSPLTLGEFTEFFHEIQQQPAWRGAADKEMDYVDGNQLNNELLRRQRELGIPPAIEQLIAPAIDAVLGLEAKNRADFRVTPDNDQTPADLAKALGFKLNQAEKKSKADRACSNAYRSQICVGVGWVEVSRQQDPFEFPYRCRYIHRNEIWWDMLAKEEDLSDARYLIRAKWAAVQQIKLMFPRQRDLITRALNGWNGFDPAHAVGSMDGGVTGLAKAYDDQRGSTIEEQLWNDSNGKRGMLYEVWYRRWVRVKILRMPDGRVVEFDQKNSAHSVAILTGIKLEEAIVNRMRQDIWLGPHRLLTRNTPYKHQKFPYVPFWGKREDRTGIPYGLVRPMIFPQDNVNATISKLRWGLAAVRVERTDGAFLGTDEQLRETIARPDADVVLSANHMAKAGARFEVKRDFLLTDQQWNLLNDGRTAVGRVAGVSPNLGQPGAQTGTAKSGLQEATQVEQGTQMLADINDNFAFSRAAVGDLLAALIIEDMAKKPETIIVPGMGLREDMTVDVNRPVIDEETGIQYLDNDIERAMLKVDINDVPSTSSYRAQQLSAMSEAFKSMPPEFQRVAMPYLVALMDLPADSREEIVKAIREAAVQPTPEQIEQRIAEAVKTARTADARDLKLSELAMKYTPEKLKAEIAKLVAETFNTNVNAMFAANQTAATIAMNPAIAPVADTVAQLAGYQPPDPLGVDPNFPVPTASIPAQSVTPQATAEAHAQLGAPQEGNAKSGAAPHTNPNSAPKPVKPGDPNTGERRGVETARTSDN